MNANADAAAAATLGLWIMAVLFWALFSVVIAAIAARKGRSPLGFFCLSFLVPLGFLVALIVLLIQPPQARAAEPARAAPPAPEWKLPPRRDSYIPKEQR
jgi:hypothetical protein